MRHYQGPGNNRRRYAELEEREKRNCWALAVTAEKLKAFDIKQDVFLCGNRCTGFCRGCGNGKREV